MLGGGAAAQQKSERGVRLCDRQKSRYKIERLIADAFQAARVAFLELQMIESQFRRSFVAGFHEVPRDVDSNDLRSRLRQGNSGRPVSTAKVQGPDRRPDFE